MPRTPDTVVQTFKSTKDSVAVRQPKPDIPMDADYWNAKREEFGIPTFNYNDLIDIQAFLDEIPLDKIGMKPRGFDVTVQSGGLQEKFKDYLRMLMFVAGEPIQLQFIAQRDKEHNINLSTDAPEGFFDPLEEEHYRVPEAPGIVWKYSHEDGRALFTITDVCAESCRYCTRGRDVNKKGGSAHSIEEIDQSMDWLLGNKKVKEVIISGGDPFTLNRETFLHVCERLRQLQEANSLDSIRFGSRRLIQTGSLPDHIYEGLSKIYNPNVMHHYNHPLEITLQVKQGMDMLHQAGASQYSQSVLLKGVNDNREVMKAAFKKGHKYRVQPYYVFMCDEVAWGKHFVVPFSEARAIFHRLSSELNGLEATARLVIDVAGGKGKIPLDSGYWTGNNTFEDFEGNPFRIDERGFVIPLDKQPLQKQETVLFQSSQDLD